MCLKKICLSFILLFVCVASIAQSSLDDTIEELVINSIVTQNNIVVKQLQNNVFINQIGENNFADTYYGDENSTQFITQMGDGNYTLMELNTVQIKADILQRGTNNTYSDYGLVEKATLEIKLSQQGDNLSFERFDTNSKKNDIQVNMQGVDKTVIVRSFD